VTGGQGVAGSNPAVPTDNRVFSNIVMIHKTQQKSHLLVKRPFQRRAPIVRHSVLPGHLPRRQSRASRPVKGSKITEPPRTCTAAPATANGPAPAPAAPAHRKPDTHRTAATARHGAGPGAHTKPAHTAFDATAAGVRTAFGRAATTAAIFTDPENKAPSSLWRKHYPAQQPPQMRCTDK